MCVRLGNGVLLRREGGRAICLDARPAYHLQRIVGLGDLIERSATVVAKLGTAGGSHKGGGLADEWSGAGAYTHLARERIATVIPLHAAAVAREAGGRGRSRGLRLRVEVEHALCVPRCRQTAS